MSRLMRTSEITRRPVVTMAGEDVAQVKDIIYTAGQGAVGGFTLAGRGLFSGPLKQALAWSRVSALGNEAVMIADADVLEDQQSVIDRAAVSGGSSGNVLGARVLTDDGTDLGEVVDVIVQVGEEPGQDCDVVGYEIASASAADSMLIPLPDTMAVSGEHLIVPAAATKFVRHDLAGFGAAIDEFRTHLKGEE